MTYLVETNVLSNTQNPPVNRRSAYQPPSILKSSPLYQQQQQQKQLKQQKQQQSQKTSKIVRSSSIASTNNLSSNNTTMYPRAQNSNYHNTNNVNDVYYHGQSHREYPPQHHRQNYAHQPQQYEKSRFLQQVGPIPTRSAGSRSLSVTSKPQYPSAVVNPHYQHPHPPKQPTVPQHPHSQQQLNYYQSQQFYQYERNNPYQPDNYVEQHKLYERHQQHQPAVPTQPSSQQVIATQYHPQYQHAHHDDYSRENERINYAASNSRSIPERSVHHDTIPKYKLSMNYSNVSNDDMPHQQYRTQQIQPQQHQYQQRQSSNRQSNLRHPLLPGAAPDSPPYESRPKPSPFIGSMSKDMFINVCTSYIDNLIKRNELELQKELKQQKQQSSKILETSPIREDSGRESDSNFNKYDLHADSPRKISKSLFINSHLNNVKSDHISPTSIIKNSSPCSSNSSASSSTTPQNRERNAENSNEGLLPNHLQPESVFFSITKPSISTYAYISRIVSYTHCSPSVFIVMLIYLQKIGQINRRLKVTHYNLHRLLITALMLACKWVDDITYTLQHYSKIGGIPTTKEMERLEIQFLKYLNFNMHVPVEDYYTMQHDLDGLALSL